MNRDISEVWLGKRVENFTIRQAKMGAFATTTFVWVCASAAAALDQDCIGLLEWSERARFSMTRGDANFHRRNVSISTDSSASVLSTRICANFQERNAQKTRENENGQRRQRILQDTTCPMELLQSVQGDADGFLSLNEYSRFFTNRYYGRCDVSEIEIDASYGLSIAQIETFNSLSCLICFGEMVTPVSSIPDCCMAKNARISLNNPLASTFTTICNEARDTAIDDCGYVAIIETPSPRPGAPPQQRPSLGELSSARPIVAPQLQPSVQACIRGLVDADTQVPDGLLNQNEFMSFLDNQFGSTCMTNISVDLRDGVFRQLACAWCLSGSGASLDCCSASAARISIAEAFTADTAKSSAWLQRVCSTINDQIGKSCESVTLPTHSPIALVQPKSAPVVAPVIQKTEPPFSFSPDRVPAPPRSSTPVASPPVQKPATNSQEEPTTVAILTPTPDPTLRPPPGDPVSASTAAPAKNVETTSAPLNGGINTIVPTQSTTFTPTKGAAQPPVSVPTAIEPPNGEPTSQQSNSSVKVLYLSTWAAICFSSFYC